MGFVLDFLLNLMTPVNTFFVVHDIDRNKIIDVVIIGAVLDFIYCKILYNVLVLLFIYILAKKIKINKKYLIIKRLVLFFIYFNISYFIYDFYIYSYICTLLGGLVSYIVYLLVVNKI